VGLLLFAPHGALAFAENVAFCEERALLRLKPSRYYDKQRILFALRRVEFLRIHG
jgi:hypothetical protein